MTPHLSGERTSSSQRSAFISALLLCKKRLVSSLSPILVRTGQVLSNDVSFNQSAHVISLAPKCGSLVSYLKARSSLTFAHTLVSGLRSSTLPTTQTNPIKPVLQLLNRNLTYIMVIIK